MDNIFLTSKASVVMADIAKKLPNSPSDLKLAFIPTAGDPYGDNKPWMDADRKNLVDLGFKVEDFDLKNKTEAQTRNILPDFDVIFVAGGNTFYLLDWARRSGFDKVAKKLVEKGTIYIGSSAGSYLACPTIEAAGWKHADRNTPGLKDLTSLGLVDFITSCHYKPEYREAVKKGRKSTTLKVITLTDRQYIKSDGKKYEVVSI